MLAHIEVLMRKILTLSIISLLFGCSSEQETKLLTKLANSFNSETKQKFQSIEMFNEHSYKIEPTLYNKFQKLDSSYRLTRNKIDSTNSSNDISALLARHVELGISMTEEDVTYEVNEIPDSNPSQYGNIELAMFTNEILYQLTAMVGQDDIRFDQLRAYVTHGDTNIKLGEAFEGRVYIAATSSQPQEKVYYLLNGDTLNTTDNFAEFSYRPTKRGTEVLKFEVTSEKHSVLDNMEFELQEVKIRVE